MQRAERTALFWGVCIPLRAIIACYAVTGRRDLLRVAAALIGGRWLAGLQVGDEGVFGGPAWWSDERHVHGLFWVSYAVSGRGEWLVADVMFGATNWALTVGVDTFATKGH